MSEAYDCGREPLREFCGRLLCGPCFNGVHADCMWGKCTCLCHEKAPRETKAKPDRTAQSDTSGFGSIKVG
jgi:hypothetical protein